jgi:hypothetical protein
MGLAITKPTITGGDQSGVNRFPRMGHCGSAIDEKDYFPAPIQRINPNAGCAVAIFDYPHIGVRLVWFWSWRSQVRHRSFRLKIDSD